MRNNKSIRRGLKEKIIALADKGLSYHQIQKRLGCSKSTISYHLGEGQKYKAYMRVRKHRLKKKIGSRNVMLVAENPEELEEIKDEVRAVMPFAKIIDISPTRCAFQNN